jgi:hypothetical protein
LPSDVFLDISGGIYRNDILNASVAKFRVYPCVLHVLPMSEFLIKTDKWEPPIMKLKLFYILHFTVFSSLLDQNIVLRILFQPSLFRERYKICKQFKTNIKSIVLFTLISTYFERTRLCKHSIQFSSTSSD